MTLFALCAALLISAFAVMSAEASPGEAQDATETPTPVQAFRLFDKQRAPGLPQSTVMDLLQDEAGILWIATLDGLGVFDGTEVRAVDPAPEAPIYGSLYSLARRRAGGLWVGGASQIWSLDGETWRVYPAPGAASSLAEDGLGRLWRVDQSGGLWRFQEDRLDPVGASLGVAGDADAASTAAGPWMRVPTPEWLGAAVALHGPVRARRLDEDPHLDARTGPKLWLAGQYGVGMLLAADARFEPVAVGAPAAIDADITALLPTRDGTCWVATADGRVHHTVAGGWRTVTLPDWQGGHIRALAEDLRGRVWAGGLAGSVAFGGVDGGWTVWDGSNGLRTEGVLTILADREGTLWFSANGFGLQQWVGEAWSHRNLWTGAERGDGRQPVFGISPSADGRGFYAAAFTRGVWHWDDRRMRTYGPADGLEENVRSVFEPEPGVLWVSARFGIYERRAPEHTFEWSARVPTGFVYGVHRAPDGRYWANTSAHGLLVRADSSDSGDRSDAWRPLTEVNQVLPDLDVKAVLFHTAADGNAEVWIGTLAGLVVLRDGEMQALSAYAAAALPSAVQALLEDPAGDVWVAGFGGLSRVAGGDLFSPDGASIEVLTQEGGLPGHTIYSLAVRKESPAEAAELWMGGSDGVGRMELGSRRLVVYDSSDGLIEDESNHMGLFAAPDGSMYVGTMASLARFDPHVEPLESASLRITWLERPDGASELAAKHRSVRLRWKASWLAPEVVQYRTRVPRLGESWSEPSPRSQLDLENLGPGHWLVEVSARVTKAGKSAGEWVTPVATTFQIEPYFHETMGFRLLCVLALAILVALFVRWRTYRLQRWAEELQAAVDEALARIRVLGGLLPICAGCKKVRDDEGYWQQIESYLHLHSEAELSHGLCPDCASELYGAYLQPEQDAADQTADAETIVAP